MSDSASVLTSAIESVLSMELADLSDAEKAQEEEAASLEAVMQERELKKLSLRGELSMLCSYFISSDEDKGLRTDSGNDTATASGSGSGAGRSPYPGVGFRDDPTSSASMQQQGPTRVLSMLQQQDQLSKDITQLQSLERYTTHHPLCYLYFLLPTALVLYTN
jgi:hypothetical protein